MNFFKYMSILALIVFFSFGCKRYYYKEADQIINKMSLEQKIGQMLIIALPGKKVDYTTNKLLKKYKVGGVILFGYNIDNNVSIFIDDLQKKAMKHINIPLFISIDQEGGRVKRIVKDITQFPGNLATGVVDDSFLTYQSAYILGMQLRLAGINMNFAPVVDVNNNPDNPVINTRSFGSDVKVVTRMGISYIKGLQKAGCVAVAKHFPGHGDTNKDSHLTLPVIMYDLKRLRSLEFIPFKSSVDNGVEGIMTAHIAFPTILKNNNSVTISKKFLTGILRNELQFQGLIITDDMEMKAIAHNIQIGEAALKSVIAGSDIILISSFGKKIDVIFNTIKDAIKNGTISEKRINDSVRRILEVKLRYNILSVQKNKFGRDSVHYTPNDLKILKQAKAVNEKLTRQSLYYYGNKKLLLTTVSEKAFVSTDKLLTSLLLKNKYKVYSSIYSVINTIQSDNKEKIIYYHVSNPNINELNDIAKICKKMNIHLVLLSTGNPFLLSKLDDIEGILFSFSNTNESIRQMVNCLDGKFQPKYSVNVELGFNKKAKTKQKQ